MHSTHFIYSELPEDGKLHRAQNAITLNLLVTRVNIGFGMNIPASIIVYKAPALYFHKIDRLIRATRCNEVYVALGFQELPQPEADYENVGIQKIISTVGNVESDSTWTKKILEWLSNGIFGKMIQLKREVTINRSKPHQPEREHGQPPCGGIENIECTYQQNLRSGGTGLHENKNRYWRQHEQSRSRRVLNIEVLLQNVSQHGGN